MTGAVFALLGIVGGMLYGSLTNAGCVAGVTIGALIGAEICSVVGAFMVLGAAFTESVKWGLIYLFVPFGQLVYIIQFWNEARRGFLLSVIGGSIGLVAFLLFVVIAVTTGAGNTLVPQPAPPAGGMPMPDAPVGMGAPPAGAPAGAPATASPAAQRRPWQPRVILVCVSAEVETARMADRVGVAGQRFASV